MKNIIIPKISGGVWFIEELLIDDEEIVLNVKEQGVWRD